MNKRVVHRIIFPAFLFLLNSVYAQDLRKDLLSYFKAFNEMSSYAIDVSLVEYDSLHLGGRNVTTAHLKKEGPNTYTNFMGQETIVVAKDEIVVDHSSNLIILYSNLKVAQPPQYTIPMDTFRLYKFMDTLIYRGSVNGLKTYHLNFTKGNIKAVDIVFSEDSKLISWYTEYFAEGNEETSVIKRETKIKYKEYKGTNEIVNDFKKYVIKTTNGYELTEKYKKYELEVF